MLEEARQRATEVRQYCFDALQLDLEVPKLYFDALQRKSEENSAFLSRSSNLHNKAVTQRQHIGLAENVHKQEEITWGRVGELEKQILQIVEDYDQFLEDYDLVVKDYELAIERERELAMERYTWAVEYAKRSRA